MMYLTTPTSDVPCINEGGPQYSYTPFLAVQQPQQQNVLKIPPQIYFVLLVSDQTHFAKQ